MRSHSRKPIARAQPWLGTFVEIRAETSDLPEWRVLSAIDAAFDEVADIHRLMSRQERGTDIEKLLTAAVGDVVSVDVRTAEVLRLALELREQSGGRFDPECKTHGEQIRTLDLQGPAWALAGPTVRILRRAVIDLDGIAKGYAVDRAIAILESRGVGATVNAGGDLRTTGSALGPVLVRCPLTAGGYVDIGRPGAAAFASSQPIVPDTGSDLAGSGINDRRAPDRRLPLMTVSVAAPSCAIADALTKVVAIDPDFARCMLECHDAAAWILRELNGALCMQRLGSSSDAKLDAA